MQAACHSLLYGILPVDEAAQRIAAAGYAGIELAAIPGMAEHVSPATAERVAALLDDLGLECAGVDAATHESERVEALVPVAKRLKTILVTAAGGGPGDDPAALGAALKAMTYTAARGGVALSFTPRAGSAVADWRAAQRLMEHAPGASVCFDPSHLYRRGGDVVEAARAVGFETAHLHLRDCPAEPPWPGPLRTQVPGGGALPLGQVLDALHGGGFCSWVTFAPAGHIRRGQLEPGLSERDLDDAAADALRFIREYAERSGL